MARFTLTLPALLCCLSSAFAMLAPQNDFRSLGKDPLPSAAKDLPPHADDTASAQVEDKAEKQNFVITDDTEVKLDGRVCKFQDVPGTATVTSIDVGSDKKTILKIHFKSAR